MSRSGRRIGLEEARSQGYYLAAGRLCVPALARAGASGLRPPDRDRSPLPAPVPVRPGIPVDSRAIATRRPRVPRGRRPRRLWRGSDRGRAEVPGAGRWLRRAIAAAMALIVIAEYASFPLSVAPVEVGARVPPVYRWLAEQEADAIVVELPADDDLLNSRYAYFSTYHWRRMVNGNSSFMPEPYRDIVRRLDDFPSRMPSISSRVSTSAWSCCTATSSRQNDSDAYKTAWSGNPNLEHLGSFGNDHVCRVKANTRAPG